MSLGDFGPTASCKATPLSVDSAPEKWDVAHRIRRTLTDDMREGRDVDFNNPVDFMHFTLTYDGPLPSCSKDARKGPKFEIRRVFHPQLMELCHTHPALQQELPAVPFDPVLNSQSSHWLPSKPDWFERWETGKNPHATVFRFGSFAFIPVFPIKLHFVCEVAVLFLRRSGAASVIQSGGDIDNRIATLFDALRVPRAIQELPDDVRPLENETPFFCLLEDDAQIIGVTVKTDRLLTPIGAANADDVRLVLDVGIQATRLTWETVDTLCR
jgi:hypothetical protein